MLQVRALRLRRFRENAMAASPRSLPRLLIVDDDVELQGLLRTRFDRLGMTVTVAASGEEALNKLAHVHCDVALLDLHLPGINGLDLLARLKEMQPEMEVILLTANSSVETAVLAMKRGAYDYLTKPFRLQELEIHIQKAYEKVQLARREKQWVHQVRNESPRHRLVGSSPVMRKVSSLIEKVAATDATVLIRGPSGTGKEVVARAIHAGSPRRDRPMVTINCAALQETLLESELFGHEKGSFTGAVHAKPGLVEVAEGGTLFIDEIGEMAAGLQAKLLRVLEDGHFRRVGATTESFADVRVIAATNRRLEDEIKTGRFREDLYYRLNVISINLPPLCERRQDVPELVEHFLTTRRWARCATTSRPTPWRRWCATPGRATSASWPTCWSGRRSWRKSSASPSTTCRTTWSAATLCQRQKTPARWTCTRRSGGTSWACSRRSTATKYTPPAPWASAAGPFTACWTSTPSATTGPATGATLPARQGQWKRSAERALTDLKQETTTPARPRPCRPRRASGRRRKRRGRETSP